MSEETKDLIDALVTEAQCMGVGLKYDGVTKKDEEDFRRAYEAIEHRFAELRKALAGWILCAATNGAYVGEFGDWASAELKGETRTVAEITRPLIHRGAP